MSRGNGTPRRLLTGILLIVSLLSPAGALQAAKDEAKPVGASIRGKVLRADGKTAVSGAVVIAYLLDSAQAVHSSPTDTGGEYEFAGLPFGYADLYVETSEGVYAGNQVVNLSPGGKLLVTFRLSSYGEKPPAWWNGREPHELPGSGKKPIGVAEIQSKVRGKEFWKSPGGIATLGAIGGGVLLAIAAGGGGGDSSASPSTP